MDRSDVNPGLAVRLLVAATATAGSALAFIGAFAVGDLAVATLSGMVAAGSVTLVGAISRLPSLARVATTTLGWFGAVVVATGRIPGVWSVIDEVRRFLTVGLPAPGLDGLRIVPVSVVFVVALASVRGVLARRPAATVLASSGGFAAAAALCARAGVPFWSFVGVAIPAGALLALEARRSFLQLPPLASSSTRQWTRSGRWRAPATAVAALVLGAFAVATPHPEAFDPSRFIDAERRVIDLDNALALAARARLDEPVDAFTLSWSGVNPGRLRIAVLDAHAPTGWSSPASYVFTGGRLTPDSLAPTGPATESSVDVRLDAPFLQTGWIPVAGSPTSVEDPEGVLHATVHGLLTVEDGRSRVVYRTQPGATIAPATDTPLASGVAAGGLCPASDTLRSAATQITSGSVGTMDRLRAIENWLKVRRVYDETAPGGQTIRSVERFVAQDFARGNLEVFVTTYALLARCVGLPARVVVGVQAPANEQVVYTTGELTAWVEVPLAGYGWVPFDPLPTPAEQLQQAQLAAQLPEEQPEPETEPPPAAASDPSVDPLAAPGGAASTIPPEFAGLVTALIVLAAGTWALAAPRHVVRCRRRAAGTNDAVLAAWDTVCDLLSDHRFPVGAEMTPAEIVRATSGQVRPSVARLLRDLPPIVDAARYAGRDIEEPRADLAWGYVDAVRRQLPFGASVRLVPLRHPVRVLRRVRSARALEVGSRTWGAPLPDSVLLSGEAAAPSDIPGVRIESRLAEGGTSDVFRAVDRSGEPVAVKVFRFGPEHPDFDRVRFDWEVRVARLVAGRPHLPVIHDAGISPTGKRPYIVGKLYEQGTLLSRVRRGGPLAAAEVTHLALDVSVALETLHQMGIVHSDVKPENVFVDDDGSWVLGDLGSSWLRTGHGPGVDHTPPYAAPEVCRGSSPTYASDIYSLGLTLLYAATGQVPITGTIPPRDDVIATFPELPVMMRVLDPDPRRRPRSAAVLAGEIGGERSRADRSPLAAEIDLPTPTFTHRRR